MKLSRNAFLRNLSGEPLEEVPGVRLSGGQPKWLLPIIEQVGSDPNRLRIFLTYLTSLRSVTLPAKLDLDPITSPPLGDVASVTDLELYTVYRTLHRGARYTGGFTEPHMSTKKGPVAQAIMSSVSELTFLPQKLIDDICLLGGKKLFSAIDDLVSRIDILDYTSVAQ